MSPPSIVSTFKPRDVEEPVDYWVNRRLAGLLVILLAPLPITPNQVTLMSGLVGVGAGLIVAFAPLDHSLQVPLGGLVLYLSLLLDCADGQLARLRKQSSMVGRALDGYVDVIPTAAMFMGSAWFLYRAGYDPIFINVVGWSAGYSMKWHVHSYDHAKNLYLQNALPPGQSAGALPTMEEIAEEREARLRAGDRFGALILKGFAHLTAGQRQGWQEGRIGLGVAGAATEEERAAYRDEFRSTMRLWTWNGLGTHLAILLAGAAATPLFRGATVAAWAFILGPVNLLTLYLRSSERRIERALQGRLRPAGLGPP